MSVRNAVKKDTEDTKKEAIRVEEKGGGVGCAEDDNGQRSTTIVSK